MRFEQTILKEIMLELEDGITVKIDNINNPKPEIYTINGMTIDEYMTSTKLKYSKQQIYYMISYAAQNKLIQVKYSTSVSNGIERIFDITPIGHELLSQIHQEQKDRELELDANQYL